TDLEMVIEAMTLGAKKKRGVLLANRNIFNGSGEYRRVVSDYHREIIENCYVLKPGDRAEFQGAKLSATKCAHSEKDCIGFVLDAGGVRLGYTADGCYYEGQEDYFKGCDCLIINCLRPRFSGDYGHMTADKAKLLVEKAKPKMAILQHLGMKMLFGVAEREAAWITKETGLKTVAAKDGQVFEFGGPAQKGRQQSLK
ncbi:MAG: MBL fold metallo-hydrolase, partial [Candidatus Aenigmatarchaeota archaeon]